MASKGKEKMKSKKKKQSVPTSSTMPNISHPLPHPSKSTSFPSTMFTIPPTFNNLVQYYSMHAKDSQSNAVFNFVPTPSIPSSSPGFHSSQHGGLPAAAPSVFYGSQHTGSPAVAPSGFHGSQHTGTLAAASPSFHGSQHTSSSTAASPGFHGSQHNGSSFVAPSSFRPSSSSIPSISSLDIGGSRPTTSSVASASSRRRRQNLGGDVQFDTYNRLIIVPHKNGFLPSFQTTHLITNSMKPFYHEPWTSWKKIPYNIREQMWNQFKTLCTWHPQHQSAINIIFEKKVSIRIKDTLFAARTAGEMPYWLRKDVWDKLLEFWNTPEWKAKSEQAKANRASNKGGSLHTRGSNTFEAHRLRMEKERGRDMSDAEVFEELHKKKKNDGTREDWVEMRASDTHEDYHKRL